MQAETTTTMETIPMETVATLTTTAALDTLPPPTPTTPRGVSQLPSMVYVDFSEYEKENIKITELTEQPDPNISDELLPCPICTRTFHPLIFEKHVGICERNAKKKRQPFDSKRQRTEGTDLANYNAPRLSSTRLNQAILSPRLNTRKQPQSTDTPTSSKFSKSTPTTISQTNSSTSIQQQQQKTAAESSKRTLVPPEEHCPYCARTFCRKAFDSHVGYCKTKLLRDANKPVDPSKELLRERMEMRQKFVPPLLNRSKRYRNRVKYSAAAEVDAREAAKSQNKSNSDIVATDKECSNNNSVRNGDNNSNNNSLDNGNNTNNSSNNKIGKMSLSMTSSLTSNSGLPDYDPFLSAKRQLEELYSPTTPNETFDTPTPSAHPTLSTPSTPTISIPIHSKMTTSLTLSTSSPNSSPIAATLNNNQKRNSKSTTTPNISNFRRSSSLRGPRRTPTLPPRPLFSFNYKPTIQRGLSDEGPISTNFLKSEEYDEMPVRSVCVNDFAITNSPRVVRRDNSASNRKHNLKLNINAATAMSAGNSSDERLSSASKYVSKTDSLAVFLKYENELEKLNAAAAATAAAVSAASTATANVTTDTVKLPTPQNVGSGSASTTAQSISSPVITKEFKDKSNTLSKQNSAKNLKLDMQATPNSTNVEPQKPRTQLPTPIGHTPNLIGKSLLGKQLNDSLSQNHNNNKIRLEPISKPGTPLTKPNTPQTTKMTGNLVTQLPVVNQPVNLNTIFGQPKTQTEVSGKEYKISCGNEYIDPKLINKCDNLPVNLSAIRTFKQFESDNSAQRTDSSASSASEKSAATNTSAPVSHLTKLLPLAKIDNSTTAVKTTTPIAIESTSSTPNTISSQRNSTEGRTNQFKRKMRLGLNQFLYDASPEAEDSCSADDEANRSSTDYDENLQQTLRRQTTTTRTGTGAQQRDLPNNLTALPIFDDFDFEEFLSSFENDDDQFPLFKDCREFLMNRTSKQRSTLTPNSNSNNNTNNSYNKNNNNNNNNNNNSNNNNKSITDEQPTKLSNMPNLNMNSPFPSQTQQQHFQFPSLNANTENLTDSHLLTCSPSFKTHSNESNFLYPLNTNNEDKREIFISIETEQNEMGRSSISPDTIRNMMGHTQAMVEIEVDPHDNKFSKISDDEALPHANHNSFGNLRQMPNVQFNNAKNLMQKMQESFRHRNGEGNTNMRQAYGLNNTVGVSSEKPLKTKTAMLTGSGDACVDSDEMSSLDGYPIARQSRRGGGTKLSADSAYGSLSRQRSSELSNHHRSLSYTRPSNNRSTVSTAPAGAMMTDGTAAHAHATQHHSRYSTSKTRARQFSGSSSSDSNNSLPPIAHNNNNSSKTSMRSNCNNNYQQQQQQPISNSYYNTKNNNCNSNSKSNISNAHNTTAMYDGNMNNNFESPLSSPTTPATTNAPPALYQQTEATMASAAAAAAGNNVMLRSQHSNSSLSSSSNMSSSMKMSKFCHECGTKFIIEHAKFCMDCGVRRIVL